MNRSIAGRRPAAVRLQFGVASLLWVTFAIAVSLAYLRSYGSDSCLMGIAVAVSAGAVGGAIGMAAGSTLSAAFWSLIGAMFGYLSAVGAPAVDPAIRCAWGAVGGVTAAVVAVAWPHRVGRSLALGGLVGGAVMMAAIGALVGLGVLPWGSPWRFDALFAPLAGAGMGAVVTAVDWAERQHATPRSLAGAGLLLAVILGNLAGAALLPWRM